MNYSFILPKNFRYTGAFMTEKELKKLNRKQLLELLLKQTERADQLSEKLEEALERLSDKTIAEAEAGTLAEAALKLNGIFEAADAAAAQYLKNIKMISKNENILIERMEAKSRKKMNDMLRETERKCAEREKQAQEKVDTLEKRYKELQEQINSLSDCKKID